MLIKCFNKYGVRNKHNILVSSLQLHNLARFSRTPACENIFHRNTYISDTAVSSLGDVAKLVGVEGEEVAYIFCKKTQVPIPRTTMPDSPSKSKYCWYLGIKNKKLQLKS